MGIHDKFDDICSKSYNVAMSKKSDNNIENIIFVTISMRGGGTERVISILANRMVQRGIHVTIMMIADPTVEYPLDERVHTVCVSEATGGSMRGRIRRIRNMRGVFRGKSNLRIISMGTVANLFTMIASIGVRADKVLSERNDPNRLNHRPIKAYERAVRNFLYRFADRIVLQTPMALDCFPESLHAGCDIIPNPLPDDMPSPNPTAFRDRTILTAGRLTEQKNHALLLDAFASFSKEFPEYVLHIFGRGELETVLQNEVAEKGLEDKVLLRGFSDDLYGELNKGGIYVSTSNWEGISNSLLEALAMGIPVVATDCPMGGSKLCIQDGMNGYLIPMNDKESLLQRMCALAENSELRERFASHAMEVREKYSVDTITDLWLK